MTELQLLFVLVAVISVLFMLYMAIAHKKRRRLEERNAKLEYQNNLFSQIIRMSNILGVSPEKLGKLEKED